MFLLPVWNMRRLLSMLCRREGAAQLQTAIGAWTHKLLGEAWRAWSAVRTHAQLRHDALERASRLWRSRALASAWRAWRAGAERSAELAVQIGPILGGSAELHLLACTPAGLHCIMRP